MFLTACRASKKGAKKAEKEAAKAARKKEVADRLAAEKAARLANVSVLNVALTSDGQASHKHLCHFFRIPLKTVMEWPPSFSRPRERARSSPGFLISIVALRGKRSLFVPVCTVL